MSVFPAILHRETRNRHTMFDNLEEIKLRRSRRRWYDNIKFDIRRVGSMNKSQINGGKDKVRGGLLSKQV